VIPIHTMLKDPTLALQGRRKVDFAAGRMPVLAAVAAELARTRPLAGMRIAACLHVTTETANLCRALHAGGAELALCASNSLSTKDDVAAAIHDELGAAVFAVHGADRDTFHRQLDAVLHTRPTLLVDDGADLTARLHSDRRDLLGEVRAGDVFVTVTGNRDAITLDHLTAMKPGAIVCNAGHFDVEVDVAGLRRAATDATEVRPDAVAYTLPGGGRVVVLAEGRLVGQSCAEASPAEVMDLTFATQALAVEHLAAAAATLGPGVHPVPAGIEERVARHKLAALGVRCDDLTAEQEAYLRDWRTGS